MTIRIGVEEKSLIGAYAAAFEQSVSDFMRESALERIEDELDLRAWDEAKREYDADPVSFSAAEIAKMYL